VNGLQVAEGQFAFFVFGDVLCGGQGLVGVLAGPAGTTTALIAAAAWQ